MNDFVKQLILQLIKQKKNNKKLETTALVPQYNTNTTTIESRTRKQSNHSIIYLHLSRARHPSYYLIYKVTEPDVIFIKEPSALTFKCLCDFFGFHRGTENRTLFLTLFIRNRPATDFGSEHLNLRFGNTLHSMLLFI